MSERARVESAGARDEGRTAADGTIDKAAGERITASVAAERDRDAEDALAERALSGVRERAADGERDPGEERASSPAESRPVRPDGFRYLGEERPDAAPPRASALVTPEAVAEVARLLAASDARDARGTDVRDRGAWRFALVDEHDGASLTFVVTRQAGGCLSVALDEADEERHAPLLGELVARLAELDERIVLERTHG